MSIQSGHNLTYAELRAASDAELIEAHDRMARITVVGTSYYLDELNRRENERLDKSIRRLTRVNIALVVVGTAAVVFDILRSFGS